jgi:hypothetical protein
MGVFNKDLMTSNKYCAAEAVRETLACQQPHSSQVQGSVRLPLLNTKGIDSAMRQEGYLDIGLYLDFMH